MRLTSNIISKLKKIITKSRLIKLSLLLFLLLILLFPAASFAGAKSGLILWWDTLLPTLLPFMIISGIIIRLRVSNAISVLLYPILKHLLPISKDGCYSIFIGFLAGMPIGAKTTADLKIQRGLPEDEAQMLCAVCNNASPMFIISYIAGANLATPKLAIPLIIILYSSSLISGLLMYHCFLTHRRKKSEISCVSACSSTASNGICFELIDDAILSAFEVVTKVGGYILLFSVLASLLSTIPLPFKNVTAFFTGILEITTGIHNIAVLSLSKEIKIVLITTIAAFGGLSGFAQTKSVLGSSGLSSSIYFFTKLLCAAIAFLLSTLLITLRLVNIF